MPRVSQTVKFAVQDRRKLSLVPCYPIIRQHWVHHPGSGDVERLSAERGKVCVPASRISIIALQSASSLTKTLGTENMQTERRTKTTMRGKETLEVGHRACNWKTEMICQLWHRQSELGTRRREGESACQLREKES